MAPSKATRAATKPVARRSKGTTPTARTAAVVLDDDDDDDEALPAAAQDPLAVEPLSAAEIRGIEAGHSGVTEQREAMLEVLRKGTEAKLPFDPDEAAQLVEPADQHLEVHLRPKHKR